MNTTRLEQLAIAACGTVLGGWLIFWIVQVIDVIELLQMAYG